MKGRRKLKLEELSFQICQIFLRENQAKDLIGMP